MIKFITMEDLKTGYATMLNSKENIEIIIAEIMAATKIKYHPHVYKGGFVIPGFGYSVDRIENNLVAIEYSGNPYNVK